MNAPRLLLYTPTYGDALRPETVKAIRALQWDGGIEWEVGRENPWPIGDMRNVVHKYAQARAMALAGGYDALVTIEHDMGPPPETLRLLWAAPADVVFGVYLFRHGTGILNALRLEGARNLGQSLSLYPVELKQAKRRGIVPVSGVGWGCTLIRRNVLERIPIRYTDQHDAGDLAFAYDCLRTGIPMLAHFGVQCLHYEGDHVWDATMEGNEMVQVEALANVVIAVGNDSMRLRVGRQYELPLDTALTQQRAGYLRVLAIQSPQRPAPSQAPLLEVLTRTNRRPTLLSLNQASLAAQTADSWVQTLLPDEQSRGIAWSFGNMVAHADNLIGQYIWILDDDDVCIRPTLVAEIATIVKSQTPDVIMVRMDHGPQLGILPRDRWGLRPIEGEIGVSAYIVRRAVWQQHAAALTTGRYASDYDFIAALWDSGASVYWHDVIASRALQLGHGTTEMGVEHAVDTALLTAERRVFGGMLLSGIDGIGPRTAAKLADAGLETVDDFLVADPAAVAAATGASLATITKWRQRAAAAKQ